VSNVENSDGMTEEATTGLATSLIGARLSGRYRLESKLGSGGMSTVYLARDETLERWVAIKVLHREISDQPDQIERFRREARAVAQLSHPNVVAVIDAGEDGGYPYIVFEYVEGETLKQRIDRLGRLPLDEAAAYAIELGRGLAAAHARMLVHRDVKPQNVLIDFEGRAKITDFGIARSLESDGLTKTGRVLGTTDYVSPEQAMGQGVDARSDIYSLGVLLYEMLTGEVPFTAETVVGVAMKHVNEEIPDVQARRPEVSSALAAAIDQATAKDPKKRYDDMASFVADLEGALEVEVARAGTAHGEATSVLETVKGPRRLLTTRRVSAAGVLLVLAATTAALLIAALTGNSEKQSSGAAPSGAPIPLVSAQDFDPVDTGGDGDEHTEEVDEAIDSDPDTAWSTETYSASPVLQDATSKPGVGLVVAAAKPVTAHSITLRSGEGDWDVEIYGTAAATPPDTLEGWGTSIGGADDVSTDQTVQLTATKPLRHFLVWITQLSPAGGPGEYRVELEEVVLNS
jgi:tRNA A-37 threonylcarbamoyl transferase component Bud32